MLSRGGDSTLLGKLEKISGRVSFILNFFVCLFVTFFLKDKNEIVRVRFSLIRSA